MTEHAHVLEILLDITRTGARFYEQAAAKASDRAVGAVLTRVGRAKLKLLDNLGGVAHAGTDAFAPAGSLAQEFRAFYDNIRGRVTAGDNAALEQLADREQRLVEAIGKQALATGSPLAIRAAAALVLPQLQAAIAALRPVPVEPAESIESAPSAAQSKSHAA